MTITNGYATLAEYKAWQIVTSTYALPLNDGMILESAPKGNSSRRQTATKGRILRS